MKKYRVTFKVYASTYVEVEAETKVDACEKAVSTSYYPILCCQCEDQIDFIDIGPIENVEESSE